MYNSGKIIIGILIFLGIATYPVYSNIWKPPVKPPELELKTPEIEKLPEAERKCIEPKEFMKAEHMKLLNEWRDSATRDGKRLFINSEGKAFSISLQNTCMKCHSNKKKFCDRCHTYVGVNPYCWDCHVAPKEEEAEI